MPQLYTTLNVSNSAKFSAMRNKKSLKTAEFYNSVKYYIFVYYGLLLFITVLGIPLAILWFLGVGMIYSKMYYNRLETELREKDLRFKMGVFFTKERTIPLEKIQDITFVEGPLLRMFNLAVLEIETAGGQSEMSNDMQLVGIKEARKFKEAVHRQREKVAASYQDRPSTGEKAPNGHYDEMTRLLKEINETLKRIEQLRG